MKTKICNKCNQKKFIIEFYRDQYKEDRLTSQCKECIKKRVKKYGLLNKQKVSKQNHLYYLKHKIKWLIRAKLPKIKKQKKEYMKIYRKTHSGHIINYRKTHKIQIKNYQKKYNKNRKERDINYRILCNLRTRIWEVLKGKNKSLSTMKLVDCSIEQLKEHLQNQFKTGMNWSNYGKWHVDHIRPCASFDLSKPKEQRKCFNYTNLRPLWAIENIRRNRKGED